MTFRLGIDTGGTYTDAVLIDDSLDAGDDKLVRATAKSLTTRHDLAIGVRNAVAAVLDGVDPADVALVSLSTTLATNAVVEGYGAPSCLVLLGQPERILERARLGLAVGSDPVERIAGAFDANGNEHEPLDVDALESLAARYADRVSGFAVAGYFAVRNPTHEIEATAILERLTGRPVTASHFLSANLDAPRRALTALFNARLIPLLDDLISAVEFMMHEREIKAPLMVVQGDGSLVAANAAVSRPVETILSGPAASVIGANYLSGVDDAIVSDIGGTTTDVALITDGKPRIDDHGATVGDWRTMVRAVHVQTEGLGGDSETGQDHTDTLTLGPRRAIPLVILASQSPVVARTLKETLERGRRFLDGAFAVRLRELDVPIDTLTAQERAVWTELEAGVVDFDTLFADPRREKAFTRLRRRGLTAASTFTPTDAAHVLGFQNDFDPDVARAGAHVWARRMDYASGEELSRAVFDKLVRDSARAVVATALSDETDPPDTSAADWFVNRALAPKADALVRPSLKLSVPVIGIGAPAITYYPGAAELLGAAAIIPKHSEVCNAVGAAVAGVVREYQVLISSPAEMQYRLHGEMGVTDFENLELALEQARTLARDKAGRLAVDAGASDPVIEISEKRREARAVDGSKTFIDCVVTAIATGRPDTAR